MNPPLFIWEPNDLMAFDSARALEAFVEPPDVDAGRAFDATGRLLSVTAEGGRTVVRDAEPVASHQEELHTALVTALDGLDGGENVREASLEELVAIAAARLAVLPPPSLTSVIKRFIARRRA
jgi:hypothetical protein